MDGVAEAGLLVLESRPDASVIPGLATHALQFRSLYHDFLLSIPLHARVLSAPWPLSCYGPPFS